jgi:NMD protein affecting ribosome stability and mRNA decay
VPADVNWTLCPACSQVEDLEYFGRVLITQPLEPERESEVRRRIYNVERRARATQPERRLVQLGRSRDGLEVLTTSQKLAHRIAKELEKAFGGRAHFEWTAREAMLEATWAPEARRRTERLRTSRHPHGGVRRSAAALRKSARHQAPME